MNFQNAKVIAVSRQKTKNDQLDTNVNLGVYMSQ